MKKIAKIIISILSVLIILNSLKALPQNISSKEITNNTNLAVSNVDIIIPDDFDTIKEGIDNADEKDTIFVRANTYEEHDIFINKTIYLTGENSTSTIIQGLASEKTLIINADEVSVSGFTLINGESIIIFSDECNITDNIINASRTGIGLYNSSGGNIKGNNISNCLAGIYLYKSEEQNIENNLISQCFKGVYIEESKQNTVKKNQIISNEQGVFASYASNNYIIENNFISNIEHAKFTTWLSPEGLQKNTWNENYWDNSKGILPKIVIGILFIRTYDPIGIFFPWFNIDWHPAKEPYNI